MLGIRVQKLWNINSIMWIIVAVVSLSHVQLFMPSWTLCPLSSTNSWSLLRFVSIELVILSSAASSSSCSQSFPASGSFPVSQLFISDGFSNIFPMNIHGWFLLELIGLVSLQSKGFSRLFSSTTVQKHQFFRAQPSWWSNSYIHIWLLDKP